MEEMTSCVDKADDITKTMLSKYAETSINVNKIEDVVGKLLVELGDVGFMGAEDIRPGLKAGVIFKPKGAAAVPEIRGEIVKVKGEHIWIRLAKACPCENLKNVRCQLDIVVDNVLYAWDDLAVSADSEENVYQMQVNRLRLQDGLRTSAK